MHGYTTRIRVIFFVFGNRLSQVVHIDNANNTNYNNHVNNTYSNIVHMKGV